MSRARVVHGALSLAALVGCASGPSLVPVPPPEARRVVRLEWISDYESALATIAHVFATALGLPRPQAVLHLLPDRRAFEAALVESGYQPEFARATARALDAVSGPRRVTLNEAALARLPWEARVALLAHELAHCLQYELGGGRRGASDQWLREGFADWVARRVIEELGGRSLTARRRDSLVEAHRLRSARPGLDALATFPQWVALVGGREGGALYSYAFLAAEFLIDRHGVPAVLRYFSLFAGSDDRAACFREAFGEDLAAFETALAASVGF